MTLRAAGLLLLAALWLPAAPARADFVVASKSEIAFSTKQMGVNFDGRFRKWQADIVFRPNALAQSKAEIDVDLGSLDFASAETEEEAAGPLWFNTKKFPRAHFASTSIRSVGGNRYEIAGKLSLKGIVHDYVVPITVTQDAAGNRVAEGTFPIKRLAHKVGEGEWADTATVADDVIVRVRMVLAPPA